MINIQEELSGARDFVRQLLQGQIARVEADLVLARNETAKVEGEVGDTTGQLSGLSQRQLELRERQRVLELKEAEYQETVTKRREAELADTSVRVIQPATPPAMAVGASKALRLILAGIIGLELLRPSSRPRKSWNDVSAYRYWRRSRSSGASRDHPGPT
ncbi:MAG: hypothetical protein HC871_01375 [Rhizobiales bacterium]|nr:hypothetical protein [Hyphomicrobiales bacterium]